jgi:hypothetical protein
MGMAHRLILAGIMACLTGCSSQFDAIPQRCASAPDPAACRQASYDAFYAAEREKLRRIGGT